MMCNNQTLGECKVLQPLWKTTWQFLKKLTIFLSYDRTTLLSGMYPIKKKSYLYKNCAQIFHFICNNPKLESLQMSINKWMDKLTVIHAHNGLLLINKTECTSGMCFNKEESQNNYAE